MYMANSRVLLIGQTGMKNFSGVNFIVFMDLHGLDEVIVIDALVWKIETNMYKSCNKLF